MATVAGNKSRDCPATIRLQRCGGWVEYAGTSTGTVIRLAHYCFFLVDFVDGGGMVERPFHRLDTPFPNHCLTFAMFLSRLSLQERQECYSAPPSHQFNKHDCHKDPTTQRKMEINDEIDDSPRLCITVREACTSTDEMELGARKRVPGRKPRGQFQARGFRPQVPSV